MSELPSQKAQLYRQHCRICGRTCSNSVGICDSPVCSVALVEKLEQQLAELESEKARLEARIMTQMLEVELAKEEKRAAKAARQAEYKH